MRICGLTGGSEGVQSKLKELDANQLKKLFSLILNLWTMEDQTACEEGRSNPLGKMGVRR